MKSMVRTTTRSWWLARALAGALTCAAFAVPPDRVQAQGWGWPWEKQQQAPVPRDPVYRPPATAPVPAPGGYGAPPPQAAPGGVRGASNPICLQLEQRLAQEANRGSQTRDLLPKIEADIRAADKIVQLGQAQLERKECFDYFLFSKTLKRSAVCIDLNSQVEAGRRRIGELDAQRQQIISSGGRSYQDDIIRELARNNCGATYQQEANRRGPFSPLWQDEDSNNNGNGQFGNLPFATYRTVCVRLCDGYYFPVSFSTLPTHFDRDADVCQSKCAAPAELFYHQNPGGGMVDAVSMKTKQAYKSLRTAFRYQKEYVQGCSCKQAEYVPGTQPPERRAEVPVAPAQPPKR
jgi:Protein of unknown function (DUF2865)